MVNSNSKKYLEGLEGLEGVNSLDGLNHSVSSRVLEGLKPSIIESFDGVRKSNARKIFGILLIIIIIDFAMDIVL